MVKLGDKKFVTWQDGGDLEESVRRFIIEVNAIESTYNDEHYSENSSEVDAFLEQLWQEAGKDNTRSGSW